jgi:hypothetical protein
MTNPFDTEVIVAARAPRGKIQAYALRMIVNAAQSMVEDDMDEDGQLNCPQACDHAGLCPDHEQACELAQRIVETLDENWREILAKVEPPEPDVEEFYTAAPY